MSRRAHPQALPAALGLAALLGALAACSGGNTPDQSTSSATGSGAGTGNTSSNATAGVGGAGAGTTGSTTGNGGNGGNVPPPHEWTECQASDQAFVRKAILAVGGRRAWGQAEINAYVDSIIGMRKADGSVMPPPGSTELELPKKLVVEALMREDAFRERWSDFLLDALHVNRIELKNQVDCYGPPNPNAIDAGALAAWVRDNDAGAQGAPLPAFTMGQLLSSALELDDLSVVYRANLFAMMNRPIGGANVDFIAMERIRRQDFGAVFDSAYIHRDIVCLSCHNSEFSVTFDDDPKKNRHWPIPGLFEQSIYGASNGRHPVAEEPTKGPDDLRIHSMLRVADVVVKGAQRPYGWTDKCGEFAVPQAADPLNIDAYFGSIRSTAQDPTKGLHASVWDLERALHTGVDALAAHGLSKLPGEELADPDEAFAYLVAENIVEKVWNEVVGSPLTIANYFPRTQVQRDVLLTLTEHFIATHFSLKTLLIDILGHPVFNLKAPVEGCGVAAYELPNLLDPWSTSDNDVNKRPNSPGDGVFALSSRPLVRSLHRAMEWPYLSEYPGDETFQVALGFFIKDADPGYRGLDFQGRLTWENVYARCQSPGVPDFITKIVTQAAATPNATVGDAIVALKDRLTGEPWIEQTVEKPGLEALIGAPLASTNQGLFDAQLRSVCGVLVSTPQFMLGGLVPKDSTDIPKLTPPEITYDATCNYVAQYLGVTGAPYTVTCGGGQTVIVKK
ncbi:MAG: hypothetical protein ABI193_16100 [Minicystis sp.]